MHNVQSTNSRDGGRLQDQACKNLFHSTEPCQFMCQVCLTQYESCGTFEWLKTDKFQQTPDTVWSRELGLAVIFVEYVS